MIQDTEVRWEQESIVENRGGLLAGQLGVHHCIGIKRGTYVVKASMVTSKRHAGGDAGSGDKNPVCEVLRLAIMSRRAASCV